MASDIKAAGRYEKVYQGLTGIVKKVQDCE
jgi:hypothetical protein